ncbi:Meiosis regulator and mRNA stability factor 1 [Manis javanica]|nr:Meiosis regulator and mRNA stability factor 1 [Manis javanica]
MVSGSESGRNISYVNSLWFFTLQILTLVLNWQGLTYWDVETGMLLLKRPKEAYCFGFLAHPTGEKVFSSKELQNRQHTEEVHYFALGFQRL